MDTEWDLVPDLAKLRGHRMPSQRELEGAGVCPSRLARAVEDVHLADEESDGQHYLAAVGSLVLVGRGSVVGATAVAALALEALAWAMREQRLAAQQVFRRVKDGGLVGAEPEAVRQLWALLRQAEWDAWLADSRDGFVDLMVGYEAQAMWVLLAAVIATRA